MRFLNGRCGSFFVFVMLLRLKREFFQMKRFFPRLKRFWASIKMSSSRWSQRRHSGSHRKTQASCSMISIRRCRRASQVMNDAHAWRNKTPPASFLRHLYTIETIVLPRQARDKDT
jgi:hypothetical protein